MVRFYVALLLAALFLPLSARAQYAVSGNDGEQPELGNPPSNPVPDTVSVVDISIYPPRIVGNVEAPFSMIGVPTSVAVAHSGTFAVVTSSQTLDPANRTKFISDDRVTVIDLSSPRHPVAIQTAHAGGGATGISINKDDTLALVANVKEGSVSIFSIRGKTLTPAGKLKLDAALGPVDVAISPDGKTVLVTQRRGHGVWRLTLDGTKLTNTGIMIQTGIDPYGVQFSHDGNYAYNTNLLGDPQPDGQQRRGTIHIGTVTSIDMKTNKVVGKVQVGPTPEHLVLSPDGRYMAVTVVNGSSSKPGTPNFHDFGYLKIFRVDGFKLSEVAQARTGRWGQGAAWSRDGRFIMQQTAISRDIEVFRFDGKTLIRDGGATMKVSGRPGAIASQFSR